MGLGLGAWGRTLLAGRRSRCCWPPWPSRPSRRSPRSSPPLPHCRGPVLALLLMPCVAAGGGWGWERDLAAAPLLPLLLLALRQSHHGFAPAPCPAGPLQSPSSTCGTAGSLVLRGFQPKGRTVRDLTGAPRGDTCMHTCMHTHMHAHICMHTHTCMQPHPCILVQCHFVRVSRSLWAIGDLARLNVLQHLLGRCLEAPEDLTC